MNHETNNLIARGSADEIDELQLQRYLDGRLNETERLDVEEMLRSNAAARRRLDALREEDRLIHDALENVSQPSHRLGDKVIATLHSEERSRVHILRNSRVRRLVLGSVGLAASLLLCVYLIKPREPVGTAVSGTAATLVTPTGDRRPLARDSRLYEGDQVSTTQGQFVRLQVGPQTFLDLDENSRISIENSRPTPQVRLESGRMGLSANREMTVDVAQGIVRSMPDAVVDIWLPSPSQAIEPRGLSLIESRSTKSIEKPVAVITVLSGTIYVGNEKNPAGVAVEKGYRVTLNGQSRSIARVDLGAAHVLETRRPGSLHTLDGVSAPDRALLGLLDAPDFNALNNALGMGKNAPAAAEALVQLQQAMKTADLKVRAEKLGAAQEALRVACEAFAADDLRRPSGRMLEGLAHMERGRTLLTLALAEPAAKSAAQIAFEAARVAFEEALKTENVTAGPAPLPDWARELSAGSGTMLKDLSPRAQTQLLAQYNRALAGYWLVASGVGGDKNEMAATLRELGMLRGELGRSVDSTSARLSEGLLLSLSGQKEKAIEALQEVLAVPMAGTSTVSRQHLDGLKQAALAAIVAMHTKAGALEKAKEAAAEFWLLYPRDNAENNPAAARIDKSLTGEQLEKADAALQSGNAAQAVEKYDEYLQTHNGADAQRRRRRSRQTATPEGADRGEERAARRQRVARSERDAESVFRSAAQRIQDAKHAGRQRSAR